MLLLGIGGTTNLIDSHSRREEGVILLATSKGQSVRGRHGWRKAWLKAGLIQGRAKGAMKPWGGGLEQAKQE